MRDHDDELILGYLLEDIHDLHGGLGVERAGRLVGKQDIRIVHKRAGDGDALHLAAGHLVRLLVELIAETDLSERFGRSRLSLRRCDARERQRKLDIRKNGLMRDEVVGLKDKANGMVAVGIPIGVSKVLGGFVVYDKVAGGVLIKPADDVQQRRFAAAGMAEDCYKFVLPELQIHAL